METKSHSNNYGAVCCTILTALIFSFSAGVIAQDSAPGQIRIDIRDTLSGNSERSQVAWACTNIANAAVYAHERNMLSSVTNEAAKAKALGASDDKFFNNFVQEFRLNAQDDFLAPALIFSQTNIMWLEQQTPYRKEFEPVYTAYLAAECARVARFSPGP
ncbi:hypothetical protein [Luteimonas sp. A478]